MWSGLTVSDQYIFNCFYLLLFTLLKYLEGLCRDHLFAVEQGSRLRKTYYLSYACVSPPAFKP